MNLVESTTKWGPVKFAGATAKLITEKPSERKNIIKATVWSLKSTGQSQIAEYISLIDKTVSTVSCVADIAEEWRYVSRDTMTVVAYKSVTTAGSVAKLLLKFKVFDLGIYATPVGVLTLSYDFYSSSRKIVHLKTDLDVSAAKINKYVTKIQEGKGSKYQEKLDKRRFSRLNDQVDMIFQVARIATFMIAGAGLAGVAVAPPVAIAAGGFVAVLGLIKLGFKVHTYMQETTTCHPETHHPDLALSKA